MPVYGGDPTNAGPVNDIEAKQWTTLLGGTDLDRASTTTATADPVLQFEADPDSTYEVEVTAHYGALTAAGFKTSWTVPSGATGLRDVDGPGSAASDATADNIAGRYGCHGFGTTVAYNGVRNSVNAHTRVTETAIVITAGTGGTVSFNWAQVASNATGTRRAMYSRMRYRKL